MISILSQMVLFKFHTLGLATVQKHGWCLYIAVLWHLGLLRLFLEVSFGFLRALCRGQTQDTVLMWTLRGDPFCPPVFSDSRAPSGELLSVLSQLHCDSLGCVFSWLCFLLLMVLQTG